MHTRLGARSLWLLVCRGGCVVLPLIVALGYAGWSAGQLEQELKDNSWLTAEANERVMFHTPLEERWSAAAGLVGVDPLQLPGYAGHA